MHMILGFLLIGHHSRDRKLLESLQSKFQMNMTIELLYVCFAAPSTNPSFWLAGAINRSFYKKSAGGLFNLGARVSLDFFRVGTLHRSLSPSHLLRVTISEIFDTPVQRASASLELLIKINNPLQRDN